MRADIQRLLYIGTLCPKDDYINPAFSPAANNFQINLLQGLSRLGIEQIEVITVTPLPAFPKSPRVLWQGFFSETLPGYCVYQIPFVNLSIIKPFTQSIGVLIRSLILLIKANFRPQIILTYNAPQRWAVPALAIAKILQIPAVCIAADVQPVDAPRFSKRLLHRLRTFWLSQFNGVIALSRLIVSEFVAQKQSWITVEGGVTPGDFVSAKPKSDPSLLYYAGTLSLGSGVELLLAAFDLLPEHFRLRITGNGPLVNIVRQASAKNPRIEFLGLLPRDDQLQLLQDAGILINPRLSSSPENSYNFPSKLLEYLGSGRPVISTMTADLDHEYADKVFICPEESPQALASVIQMVYSTDPDVVNQKCRRAREFVLKEKNWDSQGQRIYDFLGVLVSGGN